MWEAKWDIYIEPWCGIACATRTPAAAFLDITLKRKRTIPNARFEEFEPEKRFAYAINIFPINGLNERFKAAANAIESECLDPFGVLPGHELFKAYAVLKTSVRNHLVAQLRLEKGEAIGFISKSLDDLLGES